MTTVSRLVGTELRLLTREWSAMVFAFAFPTLLMLILADVFGSKASQEYGGVTPAEYYVADYLVVPLGALSLIGLPVMLASYRERHILRRFEAAGVPVGSVAAAQAAVTCALVVLGAAVVLAVAAPTYGVPAVQHGLGAVAGFVVGTSTMILLGTALGLMAPTARSAQALGLLAFLPMWLLGAGGPPRPVMPELMASISDLLPLGRAAAAVREPWLDTGTANDDLTMLTAWLIAAAAAVLVLLRRRSQ